MNYTAHFPAVRRLLESRDARIAELEEAILPYADAFPALKKVLEKGDSVERKETPGIVNATQEGERQWQMNRNAQP